ELPRAPIEEPSEASPLTIPSDEKSQALARGGLASADTRILSSYCREEAYSQGAVILREGDEGNALSVIARGSVRISRRIPGAGEEAFAILEPGATTSPPQRGQTSKSDPAMASEVSAPRS